MYHDSNIYYILDCWQKTLPGNFIPSVAICVTNMDLALPIVC
jgi:hypothetical protein